MGAAGSDDELRQVLDDDAPDDALIVHGADPAYAMPAAADLRRAGLRFTSALSRRDGRAGRLALPIAPRLSLGGRRAGAPRPRPDAADHGAALRHALGWRRADGASPRPLGAPSRPRSRRGLVDLPGLARLRWEDRARGWPRCGAGGVLAGRATAGRRLGGVQDAPPTALGQAGLRSRPRRWTPGDADLWLWPSILLYDGRGANRRWMQEVPEPISYAAWGGLVDVHPALRGASGHRGGRCGGAQERARAPCRRRRASRTTWPRAWPRWRSVRAIRTGPERRRAWGERVRAAGPRRRRHGDHQPDGPPRGARLRERDAGPARARGAPVGGALQGAGDGPRRRRPLTIPLPEGYDPHRDLYPPHDTRAPLGDGRRPAALHRLRGLRGGLLRGEQPGRDGGGQVRQGREMAWLKVIPYRHPEQPGRLGFLPLACQQCDAAPCEPVCPSSRPSTTTRASTTRSTTAASARATARTTALTRCAASTGSTSNGWSRWTSN